jgi:biotin operon repressor
MEQIKLEAKSRLVTSAPITDKVGKQFRTALFKNANLAKFGFVNGSSITTKTPISEAQLQAAIAAIKKAGFTKSWVPERWRYGADAIGLATKDGKWPIIVQIPQRIEKDGQSMCKVRILNGHYDTLDRKADNKASNAAYKAVIQETAKRLGVKIAKFVSGTEGRWVIGEVHETTNLDIKEAEAKLKPLYGKPFKTEPGRRLHFKKDYGSVSVNFAKDGSLSAITCGV